VVKKKKKTSCSDIPEDQKWYFYVYLFATNHIVKFLTVLLAVGFIIWLIFNFSFSASTKKGGLKVKADPVKIEDMKK